MDTTKLSTQSPQPVKQKETKYPTIRTRLTVAFTLLGTLVVAVVIFIQFSNFRTALRNEIKQRLGSITRIAALQQDGDLLTKISAGNDEFYQKVNSTNLMIKDSDPDLVFVYTLRKNDQGIYFVVDANRPGDEDISAYGEIYLEPSSTLVNSFDTMDQTIIEPEFYTDEYGTFLSAYAPIYSSTQDNVGVLGIDINASKVVEKERAFLWNSLLILIVIIPIIYILGSVFSRIIASPLSILASETQKIGEGHFEMDELPKPGTREVFELSTAFQLMIRKINELVNSLEGKVSDRTALLEQANKRLEYRENLLLAVAEVTRAIASIGEMSSLLPKITEVISERFGHYHVGIFLLDDKKEFAVLKAANSMGGRRMLARGHRLKAEEEGIVGYVTGTGKSRIALDTGSDKTHFKNPDLPETRSELALPLLIGEQIIGALDVQSKSPNAFNEDDIRVLETLSYQVAIAIQNANLFTETRDQLEEAMSIYQKFVASSWNYFMGHSKQIGYQYSNNIIQTLGKPLDRPEINAVLNSGQSITESSTEIRLSVPTIAVPIKVRGETIGVIDIRSINQNRTWDKTDLATVQTIADRLAFALENARLVDESQKRAARERAVSEMTAKIGSSVDVNSILQQTVKELGLIIGNSEVVIQLTSEDNKKLEDQ